MRASSYAEIASGTNNQLRLTATSTGTRPYMQWANWDGSSYVRRGYIGYPTAGSATAHINFVADNGNIYITANSGEVNLAPKVSINGGPELSDPSSADYLRVTTAHGRIDLGPQNTSYCHVYTDRARFYFNKWLEIGPTSGTEGGQVVLHNGTSYSLDWTIDNQSDSLRFFNSSLTNGDVRFMYLNTTTSGNTVRWNSNGSILRFTSLSEMKEDVTPINDTLEYLNERSPLYDLEPVLFHEKDQIVDGEVTNSTRGEYVHGFLAEQVYDVLPELATSDGRGALGAFKSEELIAMLVAEVQRLGGMVNELYQAHDPDWVAPVASASR